MDYTKVPRELIWADRTNIDDFLVDKTGTLDNIMFERIGRSMICNLPKAAEYVLEIYNNAYYITTLILMEKYPVLYFNSYIEISMSTGGGNNTFKRYFSCMTMAMVFNYLRASDSEYCKENNLLMERIRQYHNECYSFGMSDDKARSLFFDNVLSLDGIKKHKMRDVFKPRSIRDILKYENAGMIALGLGIDYIVDSITNIVGRAKQLNYLNKLIHKLKKSNIHGLEKKIRELEEGKDFITGSMIMMDEDGNFVDSPQMSFDDDDNVDLFDEEEEYYKQEESKPISQTDKQEKESEEQMQATIDKQKTRIKELEAEISELKFKVEELLEPVNNLTAKQKVRMELAFLLLQEAGMTDEVLHQQGNKQKAAKIMSVLLDIKNENSRGNSAQTCATYLSARDLPISRHKQTIAELNPLLKDLGLSIQLA